MAESEKLIKNRVRHAINSSGKALVWNNPVGTLSDGRGGYIAVGLGKGSCDLVGFVIGSARFFCIETKTATGKLRADQIAWMNVVRKNGGVAEVARSVEDAIDILQRAITGKI